MDTDLASKPLAAARAGDAAQVRVLWCRAPGTPRRDGAPDAPGGITPLMAAAAGGHEAVLEVLLACGADAARRDARGQTGPCRRGGRGRKPPFPFGPASRPCSKSCVAVPLGRLRNYLLEPPPPVPVVVGGIAPEPVAAAAVWMRYSPRSSSQAVMSLTHVMRNSPRPAMPW
jgi:hypothetical protein